MTERKDIREHLIEELKKDLVGPREGEEIFWSNDGDIPTSRYLAGVLYPKHTKLDQNNFLKATTESEKGEDEEETADTLEHNPFATTIGTQPSSLGMTCCVSEKTKNIECEVNFGLYEKQTREKKTKEGEEYTEIGWKRKAEKEIFTISTTKNGSRDIKKSHVSVVWKIIRKLEKYYISIYLLNTKEALGDDVVTESDQCIFQPEIILRTLESSKAREEENIFLPMAKNKRYQKDPEEIRFDVLFRNKQFFAVGRNCSVQWDNYNERKGNKADWVKTTFVPRHNVEIIQPRKGNTEPLENNLRLSTLKNVKDFSEYEKLLSPIILEYESWIENIKKRIDVKEEGLMKFERPIRSQIKKCENTKERIIKGIELISTDPIAGQAFQFANEAMHKQMIHSRWAKDNISQNKKTIDFNPNYGEYEKDNPPKWYIFQIAFILLNLESILKPESKDREIVDLLWFPTGGGKTEAYLGIVAFLLGLKRLRKGENGGIAVLMRYTYRLLTIQQFHRAAALMCACEYIRGQDKTGKWGKVPFRVGLFVGNDTTPNSLEAAKKNLGNKSKKSNPVQMINCPWCGKSLDHHNYHVVKNPLRMAIKCANPNCYFGNKDNDESYIPVVFVDDDIIRTLPSLLIGTVDKFARLAWESKFAALFGKVRAYCGKHGYNPAGAIAGDSNPGNTMITCNHKAVKAEDIKNMSEKEQEKISKEGNWTREFREPIPPPELIIQDELHLITGPTGTLVGLYESVVEDLCLNKGIKPKIVASTATIKNSEKQIQWLFGRTKSEIFPPQVLDFGDTYFSDVIPDTEKVGRIHVGICSSSAGILTADARIAAALLRKIRFIRENKNKEFSYSVEEIDAYYTLVSYYNTVRNVSSAVRYYEDSVPPFMGAISQQFEPGGSKKKDLLQTQELTGRLDASEIPDIFKEVDIGLTEKMCSCDEKDREPSKENDTICETCKKQFKRPLDALLCTNMLSVGVDIQRLSLMLINNQPKHTSEYIQASGRIGRSKSAGLVVTSYRYLAPRDLSIYENFGDFHATYHRRVEPGTLTPFASRARETGLFGILVAYIRNYVRKENNLLKLSPNDGAGKFKEVDTQLKKLFDEIKERLRSRVEIVDNKEKDDTIDEFEQCRKEWIKFVKNTEDKEQSLRYKRIYHPNAGKPKKHYRFLLKTVGDIDPPGFVGKQIPTSMRQTDGDVKMYYKEPKEEDEDE